MIEATENLKIENEPQQNEYHYPTRIKKLPFALPAHPFARGVLEQNRLIAQMKEESESVPMCPFYFPVQGPYSAEHPEHYPMNNECIIEKNDVEEEVEIEEKSIQNNEDFVKCSASGESGEQQQQQPQIIVPNNSDIIINDPLLQEQEHPTLPLPLPNISQLKKVLRFSSRTEIIPASKMYPTSTNSIEDVNSVKDLEFFDIENNNKLFTFHRFPPGVPLLIAQPFQSEAMNYQKSKRLSNSIDFIGYYSSSACSSSVGSLFYNKKNISGKGDAIIEESYADEAVEEYENNVAVSGQFEDAEEGNDNEEDEEELTGESNYSSEIEIGSEKDSFEMEKYSMRRPFIDKIRWLLNNLRKNKVLDSSDPDERMAYNLQELQKQDGKKLGPETLFSRFINLLKNPGRLLPKPNIFYYNK